MEKFFERLFDIKRIPTKFIFVIWFSSALLLFLPKKALDNLKVSDFIQEFGKFIGISFIVSSAFLLVVLGNYLYKALMHKRISRKLKDQILKELNSLDFHEKSLVREFYINGKFTLQMPMDDETVIGLSNKSIIYQASNTGFVYLHGPVFTYTLSNFVRENLTNEMIDLPAQASDDQKRWLLKNRPGWAIDKARRDNLFS